MSVRRLIRVWSEGDHAAMDRARQWQASISHALSLRRLQYSDW
jgi:hypothetical protein